SHGHHPVGSLRLSKYSPIKTGYCFCAMSIVWSSRFDNQTSSSEEDVVNHTSVTETRHNPAALHQARQRPRIPPNVFDIPFGLAGLANVWDVAQPALGTPAAVANAMYLVSAAIWLVILAAYLRQGPRHLLADLRDGVAGPFVSLAVITPLLDSAALG